MRILFVTPTFAPFMGGGERYAHSLALALAQQGHALIIVTSRARSEEELWLGTGVKGTTETRDGPLRVVRCPVRPFPGGRRGLLAWRRLMVILSHLPGRRVALLGRMARRIPPIAGLEAALAPLADRVDIVHGFNISWEHALVAAHQFAAQHGLPFVATPFTHLADARVALNMTMQHQRALLSAAGAVLALTTVEKRELAQYGVQPARITVIGSGLDPIPWQDGQDVHSLEKYGLREPYAIYIGRLNRDKGVMDAVAATLRQHRQGTPVTLALVGRRTAEFDRFYNRLTEVEREIVRPLGAVNERAKHALLAGAEMLLLPSRVESLGIVILEAWAHAVPAIGARAGGIMGVIEEEVDGLLVPFGDVPALAEAMGRLLADKSLRRSLGARGKEKTMREFTWERVTDKVSSVYAQLAS